MNRSSRTAWRASFVGVAAALTALAPAAPATAESITVTVVLASGEGTVSDPFTRLSTDGGASWQSLPPIVEPDLEWDVIPGSQWVSTDRDLGRSTTDSTTLYRRTFVLPAGAGPSEVRLCVLAQGAATARLNGTVVIEQGNPANIGNHKNPADCYGQPFSQPSLLRPGPNVLEFAVFAFAGQPTGLDYRADIAYSNDLDAAPLLVLPDDITVEATSASGANVWFDARAYDTGETGLTLIPTCTPGPNSVFAVGTTTVTCEATGSRGRTSTGTFDVTVTAPDQPPSLQLPADLTVPATSPAGAVVAYTATATDDGAGSPVVACTPPPASTFPVGTTTVSCTATDDQGLTSTGSFTVTVTAPVATPTYLERLGTAIADGRNISPHVRALLASKHRTATDRLAAGRTAATCRVLREMDGIVVRYRGAGIPVGKATNLRNLIRASRAQIHC